MKYSWTSYAIPRIVTTRGMQAGGLFSFASYHFGIRLSISVLIDYGLIEEAKAGYRYCTIYYIQRTRQPRLNVRDRRRVRARSLTRLIFFFFVFFILLQPIRSITDEEMRVYFLCWAFVALGPSPNKTLQVDLHESRARSGSLTLS